MLLQLMTMLGKALQNYHLPSPNDYRSSMIIKEGDRREAEKVA